MATLSAELLPLQGLQEEEILACHKAGQGAPRSALFAALLY